MSLPPGSPLNPGWRTSWCPELPFSVLFLPCPVSPSWFPHGESRECGSFTLGPWLRRGSAPLTTLRGREDRVGGGGKGHRCSDPRSRPLGARRKGIYPIPRSGLSCQDRFSLHCGFHYFSFPDYFGSWLPWELSLWKAPASFPLLHTTPPPSISIPS